MLKTIFSLVDISSLTASVLSPSFTAGMALHKRQTFFLRLSLIKTLFVTFVHCL